jgi:hypothetical protein
MSAEKDPQRIELERELRPRWDVDASLRAEFLTFEDYCAFTAAARQGRVKLLGDTSVQR